MKKALCFALLVSIFTISHAQQGTFGRVPDSLRNIPSRRINSVASMSAKAKNDVKEPEDAPKLFMEEQIGVTTYDLQTNASVQNRIYRFPDGTIGGTWNFSTFYPYPDDTGSGYNYFNGSGWGLDPVSPIESINGGWPSYVNLGSTGELLISQNGDSGLYVFKRLPKGVGSWELVNTISGPICSDSSTGLYFPRAISDDNNIYLIACTKQGNSSNPCKYQGLSAALLYYHSSDSGYTWTGPEILPGMDSASIVTEVCQGFYGDTYNWAYAMGDTVAFVVGGSWNDLFLMKSMDAGNSWIKTTIYNFPEISTVPTPIIASNDGSVAVTLDKNGKAHVVFGKMRVSDDVLGDDTVTYYPYTDGVIYWDENMLPFDSALLNNDSLLFTQNIFIGGMLDYSGDGIISFPSMAQGEFPFGIYYLSLSSMPQIIVQDNQLIVTYSSVNESKQNPIAHPNFQCYRDLYLVMGYYSIPEFTEPCNIVDTPLHAFDECVFGSLSYTSTSKIYMCFQLDEEPGLSAIGDMDDGSYTNYIYTLDLYPYIECYSGIDHVEDNNQFFVYPNPAKNYINITINIEEPQDISARLYNTQGAMVRQKIYNRSESSISPLVFETDKLTKGLYILNLTMEEGSFVCKFIID